MFVAGNHVRVPYLTSSRHPHKINFSRRVSPRLLLPSLAPKPGSTTIGLLVSTLGCEWLFLYTPTSPLLVVDEFLAFHRTPLTLLSSQYASTQLSQYGSSANKQGTAIAVWLWSSSARSPPAFHIRATDKSHKAHQQTGRRHLINSRLMLHLPRFPAMGHLLISPPPTARRATRQTRRMLHTTQGSSQAVFRRWLSSFLDSCSDRL